MFFFRKHWQSIRGVHVRRPHRIQDRVNFLYPVTKQQMIDKLHNAVDTSFKFQASFGFVLEHADTLEQRYFHPSQNNAGFFSSPPIIRSKEDLERHVGELFEYDSLEWARKNRPDTKWRVVVICQLTCYLNRLKNFPIGRNSCHKVPTFISRNKGLDNSSNKFSDQLCFFRCLAAHRGRDVKVAKDLCLEMGFNPTFFEGFSLDDLHKVEKHFKIQIWVYSLEKETDSDAHATLIRRSPFSFGDKICLNVYESHFSRIVNMDKYCKRFPCGKCGHVFTRCFNAQRHERICIESKHDRYPGGVYKQTETVFEEMDEIGIKVPKPLRIFPYRAVYDIEVFFKKVESEQTSEKTEWQSLHVPASIGVTSNVKHFSEDKCFISSGDSQDLTNKFMEYLIAISSESYRRLKFKFREINAKLITRIEEEEERCSDLEQSEGDLWDGCETRFLKHLKTIKTKLDTWMRRLVVLGFNSGKYDLNVLLPYIIRFCKTNGIEPHPIKRNFAFISLFCDSVQFLDISNYLGAGTSYEKYLKAYNPEGEVKGFFPYEWFTGLEKLDETQLPDHKHFFSSLKGKNISQEEYESCKKVWKDKNMKTMRDYLHHYQLLDVRPFLRAIEKQIHFYKERNLDLFKEAFSLPGISSRYVFKTSPNAKFMLFNEKNGDIDKALESQMTGGPAIVFKREGHVGFTKIKKHIFGDKAETVQSIIGYDSNSLYLSCTAGDMPTGYMLRRKAPSFMAEKPSRGEKAVQWLEYLSEKSGVTILHEMNAWPNGERRVGGRMYKVDGFFKDVHGLEHVYEMHGCIHHAHNCIVGNEKKYDPKTTHIFNKHLTWEQVAAESEKRDKYIRTIPNTKLTVMYECEWEQFKKDNSEISQFLKENEFFKTTFKSKPFMPTRQILEMVVSEELFGMVWCDIEVPLHLRDKFASFPPIFKHAKVGINDIGEFMRNHCIREKLLSQERKLLISSYFGKAQLIPTPLLKWYIMHGLVVTDIYEVLEYKRSKCFEEFAKTVSEARRSGDVDPSQSILGAIYKLLGNSFYGKMVTNKRKQTDVVYCTDAQASLKVNDKRFMNMHEIDQDYYEVL
jgi:hypothetical protein